MTKEAKAARESRNRKANAELKAVAKDYYDTFKLYSEADYNDKLLALKPGQPAPEKGKLSGVRRERMEEKAAECRSKAADILNRELAAVNKEITAAPSTEAVNTISLLALRDPNTIGPEVIKTLLDEYGDNVQSYETIRDIAKQKRIVTDLDGIDHPLREQQANIEALNRSLYGAFDIHYTEAGHNSEGFVGLLNLTIDNTFDPE